MKRPQITLHAWYISSPRVVSYSGKSICSFPCKLPPEDAPPETDWAWKEEDAANARAIAAIPTLLPALENAYLRAQEQVDLYRLLCQGCNSQVTQAEYDRLHAIRDEYKTALQAAGYVFED